MTQFAKYNRVGNYLFVHSPRVAFCSRKTATVEAASDARWSSAFFSRPVNVLLTEAAVGSDYDSASAICWHLI